LNQAKIVESQLSQRGIKPAVVRGYGSDLPVASNDTSEGREKEPARGDLDQEESEAG
jgi:outer membrane protein OmpA-like peptidoglycan-associated protein